jgi:hypothetical protein
MPGKEKLWTRAPDWRKRGMWTMPGQANAVGKPRECDTTTARFAHSRKWMDVKPDDALMLLLFAVFRFEGMKLLERQRAVHEVMGPSHPLRAKIHLLWRLAVEWRIDAGAGRPDDPIEDLLSCRRFRRR